MQAEYNGSWNLVFKYTLEGDSYYDPLLSIRVASDGETHFFLPDGLGSMRNLIHGDNISSSYSYDAFGNIMSSSGNTSNPYHYVGALGYYLDTTSGLLQVGARYYNPKVGRFITRDPIGYAGGLNKYRYVHNQPTSFSDPSGKVAPVVVGGAVVVGGGLLIWQIYDCAQEIRWYRKAVDMSYNIKHEVDRRTGLYRGDSENYDEKLAVREAWQHTWDRVHKTKTWCNYEYYHRLCLIHYLG